MSGPKTTTEWAWYGQPYTITIPYTPRPAKPKPSKPKPSHKLSPLERAAQAQKAKFDMMMKAMK